MNQKTRIAHLMLALHCAVESTFKAAEPTTAQQTLSKSKNPESTSASNTTETKVEFERFACSNEDNTERICCPPAADHKLLATAPTSDIRDRNATKSKMAGIFRHQHRQPQGKACPSKQSSALTD
jgi:hypothetical protein